MIAKNSQLLILGIAAAGIWVVGHRGATAQSVSPANAQTGSIVAATDAFLNSLDAAQREKVQLPFTPQRTATAATFSRGNAGRGPGGGGPQGGPGRPGGPGGPGGDAGRGRGRGGGDGKGPGGGGF